MNIKVVMKSSRSIGPVPVSQAQIENLQTQSVMGTAMVLTFEDMTGARHFVSVRNLDYITVTP